MLRIHQNIQQTSFRGYIRLFLEKPHVPIVEANMCAKQDHLLQKLQSEAVLR